MLTEGRVADRTAMVEVLLRYFAAVDDKCLDQDVAVATFADDGQYVRPNGLGIQGPTDILESQLASFARFRATHHVMTDHIVTFDEQDSAAARVRANLTAMHLWADGQGDPAALSSHFVAGGVLAADMRSVRGQWRIQRLELRPVWRDGSGFAAVASTR